MSDRNYNERLKIYFQIISNSEDISSNQELFDAIANGKEKSPSKEIISKVTCIQRDLWNYISEFKKNNPTAKVNLRGAKKFDFLRLEAKKYLLFDRDKEIFTVYCTKIRKGKDENVYIWTKEGCADRVAHYIRDRFDSMDINRSQNERLFVIADYDSILIHFKNQTRRKMFIDLLTTYIVPSKNGLLLPPEIHQSTKKEGTEQNTD